MLSMLVAYDEQGEVIATLDHLVHYDDQGNAIGLVDFDAIEASGTPLRLREDGSEGVWNAEGAVGSGTWPEWVNPSGFTVETEGEGRQKRIIALVHSSGHRRERAAIEAAIAERIAAANGEPADIRDIVGGPDRPLRLDATGRTQVLVPRPSRTPLLVIPRLEVEPEAVDGSHGVQG